MSQKEVHPFEGVILQVILYLCVCHLHNAFSATLKTDSLECKRLDACRCLLTKDEGYDLSSLNDKWLSSTRKDNLTFSFHPCTDKSIGYKSNECYAGVSMCLFNHSDGVYKSLGFANETTVESQGANEPIHFVIRHNKIVTRLQLECDPDEFPTLQADLTGPDQYSLHLRGPEGCRRPLLDLKLTDEEEPHLSTGSVLVIILVVLTSVYLVGGALTLRLLRGAEGLEMIPNYDFWSALPGLVKEGFLFTMSGFKTPQAYDRI